MKVIITEKLWDIASYDKDRSRYGSSIDYYVDISSIVMKKEVSTLNISDYSCDGKYLIDKSDYIKISETLFDILINKYKLVPSKRMLSFPCENMYSDFYGVSVTITKLRETGLISRPRYLFGEDLVVTVYLGAYGELRISNIIYSQESIEEALQIVSEFGQVLSENSVAREKEKTINVKFLMFSTGKPILLDRTIDLKNDLSHPALFDSNIPEEDIVNFLESSDSGIVIFHGIPGSGKSSYIKHLIHSYSDSLMFCIVDGNSVDKLDSLKKCLVENTLTKKVKFKSIIDKKDMNKQIVYILEDCEKILESRTELSRNSAVSDLLNLSDGIMGDLIGCKFIFTFNSEENIDSALLRKGRTKFMYEFKAVTGQRLEELAEVAGIQLTPEDRRKGLTLAEIFNYDKSSYIKEKTKLGF